MALAVALAAALAGSPPPSQPDPRPWRVVDTPACHVGFRDHLLARRDEVGLALTVQVTAVWITW